MNLQKKKSPPPHNPPDLQLITSEYHRPQKDKWEFQGELLGRRHSEREIDKIFYGAIREYIQSQDQEPQALNNLRDRLTEERKKIAGYLDYLNLFSRCFQDLANKNEWDCFSSLLKAGVEVGITLTDQEKAFVLKGLQYLASENKWLHFSSLFEIGINQGIIEIQKDERLIEVLNSLLPENKHFVYYAASFLLKTGKDLKELEKYFDYFTRV